MYAPFFGVNHLTMPSHISMLKPPSNLISCSQSAPVGTLFDLVGSENAYMPATLAFRRASHTYHFW
jgi:hypothetical protein